jgi:hypothetical protein
VRVARLGTFGYTADPTLGDFVLVLVFLFVLLAVSALAPPARNHSAFVSVLFVADPLVFGWLFFFADFFVFIRYLLVRAQSGSLCGIMLPPIWEVDHIGGLEAPLAPRGRTAHPARTQHGGRHF